MANGNIKNERAEEIIARICQENSTTEEKIWDSINDYRNEYRRSGYEMPLSEALDMVADELSVTREDMERIFIFLDRKFDQ